MQPNTPPSPGSDLGMTPQQWLAALVRSHLLSETVLNQVADDMTYKKITASESAQQLIELGHLTRYQARRLSQGRPDGLIVGPYRIEEPCENSPFGRTFRAHDPITGRQILLLLVSARLTYHPAQRERIIRGVSDASILSHPHLVSMVEVLSHRDRLYLICNSPQLYSAQTLLEQFGPLPEYHALDLIRQAALGLARLHEAGIHPGRLSLGHLWVERVDMTQQLRVRLLPLDCSDPLDTNAFVPAIDIYAFSEMFTLLVGTRPGDAKQSAVLSERGVSLMLQWASPVLAKRPTAQEVAETIAVALETLPEQSPPPTEWLFPEPPTSSTDNGSTCIPSLPACVETSTNSHQFIERYEPHRPKNSGWFQRIANWVRMHW